MNQQGVGRIMWGCGTMHHPLPSINVKCLTGRLSEEELQRAVAPLELGRGGGSPRPSFCQLPHASITLSLCIAITGMLLHRESNDLMALLTGKI